jgi:hypothetical protein
MTAAKPRAGSASVRTSLPAGACKTPSNVARITGNGGISDRAFTCAGIERLYRHETAFDLDELIAFCRIGQGFRSGSRVCKRKGDCRGLYEIVSREFHAVAANTRRARVFLTTWNSPPVSRIFARIPSMDFIFAPVYSTRITASLRLTQSLYEPALLPCVVLKLPKVFTSFQLKSLCHLTQAKTFSQTPKGTARRR